jgi:hypothetical protein
MSELELQLTALGRELDFPREPDLAPAVRERLEGRRPFPWRAVAVAFAVVVLAVGAAFAVPPARSAILRFFHLGGESVQRVQTLPSAVERSQAGGLGSPLSRSEAERRVGFRLVLPPLEGDGPRRVYLLGDTLATVVLHAYGHPVLLSEFQSSHPEFLQKLVVEPVEPVRVNGARGLWVKGVHTLSYFNARLGFRERPVKIHGNVLLWVRGPLTLRLEGRLTKEQALALARRVG